MGHHLEKLERPVRMLKGSREGQVLFYLHVSITRTSAYQKFFGKKKSWTIMCAPEHILLINGTIAVEINAKS